MVTFKENDKNLVIPSALGNFPSNGGGEGGLTPEEAQEMIDASISGYDETVQAEFANTNSGVSANTQAIEELSASTVEIENSLQNFATTATTEGLSQDIESLSGATEGISADLAALSAYTETLPSDLSDYATTAETSQISTDLGNLSASTGNLSAVTVGIETDVDNLGVDVENLSAATSGIAVGLETLSAYTAGISINDTIYSYDAITALTKAERATLFQEIKTMANNGKKVWVYREQNYDRYWFLIDTATNSLMYFTAKNSDSINRFELKSTGDYNQTKTYYHPKASTSTLGCIKVGSGLTIDNNGVLSVSGGSSDSNYVIVEALSAITSPVEGMIAYVSGRTYIDVIEGYKCQRNQDSGSEGDVAGIYLDGNQLARVYQSGLNFYWDWTNDGFWNTYNREYGGNYYPIEYKTYNDNSDNMNSYFIFEKSLGGLAVLGATVTPNDQATVTDYSEEVQRIQTDKFYQYKGGEWQRLDIGDEYILDDMTTAERVALYNKIKALWDAGERDFSQFKIYSYPNKDISQSHSPWLLQFYLYNTDGGGMVQFGTAAARRDWARAINGFNLTLYFNGSIGKSTESIEPTAVFKLALLRDRDYLAYTNGTFSGYTFDATNVGTDVTVCEFGAGGNWLFRVYKDGNARLVDGDWNEYIDDNEWHYKERAYDVYSLKCEYKRTGQTITVAFIQGGPASASEMQFNENVTYSGTTSSLNIFSTNVSEDIVYTGNTCSPDYRFEQGGVQMFADGTTDNRIPVPLFNFRTITAEGETRYSNPVVSYRKVPTTVLYDANGNPWNFNERFFFNYGGFTVSLLAGEGNEYRYAQLTVTAN